MTRLRLAAMSVAVVLFSSSIASADPVNNVTNTSTSGSPGLSGSITGIASDNTVLYNGGVSALAFSTHTTGGYGGDSQILVGQNFRTFCIELTGGLVGDSNTAIETVPPAAAPPNGYGYVQGGADVILQRAAWVIYNAGSLLSGYSANIVAAATQLAVWDIIYDAGTLAQGDVSNFGNGSTGFKVNSGFTEGSASAVTQANALLLASWNSGDVKLGEGIVFRQGITYNHTTGQYSSAANGQTIMAAVPEPSTFAIAGVGALGMLGYGLKRRKIS
ncbi:PEP-CTERM sorting domain-containing protein [Aquisphaera insulae]|uniref:PEP-CTERM sorting domain-containing protein n=1 Tax=Aquisphaera insulae TaxID=2712864 RepID=UPI0013ED7DCC|nr:PEP-CTERM sorting domain-containing protein [Aquisphaera insulae]